MSRAKQNRKQDTTAEASAPTRWWRVVFVTLCAVGVALSADLARIHVKVHTDPEYESYCSLGEALDCAAVAETDWAVWGGLPLAILGLVGYLVLGALALSGLGRGGWPAGLLFWMSSTCTVLGLYLFYLSHFVIESVCLLCVGTYLVNVALVGVSWFESRRSGAGLVGAAVEDARALLSSRRHWIGLVVAPVLLLVALRLVIPAYWSSAPGTGPAGLAVGTTDEGHPWIGASNPVVEVVEFSDYQCPACQRGHKRMRKLLRDHRDALRLVHRHYPLDQACNPIQRQVHAHACHYAYLTVCAAEQDRFWEASDYVFTHGKRPERVTTEELARELGLDQARLSDCMDSRRPRDRVAADVLAGRTVGVTRTPTFLLDGKPYAGLPEQELRERLPGWDDSP